MEKKWVKFDNGKSLETKGSEEGTIIKDESHSFGARITIEENTTIAPYSITIGVYGLLFHTVFCSSLDEVNSKFEFFKLVVEDILNLYEVDEKNRDQEWKDKHNSLTEKLTNS
jgi:hypothetical protein